MRQTGGRDWRQSSLIACSSCYLWAQVKHLLSGFGLAVLMHARLDHLSAMYPTGKAKIRLVRPGDSFSLGNHKQFGKFRLRYKCIAKSEDALQALRKANVKVAPADQQNEGRQHRHLEKPRACTVEASIQGTFFRGCNKTDLHQDASGTR